MSRLDTEVVFDPGTYVRGVPRLRRLGRVRPVWRQPDGPGGAGEPAYLRSNFQRGVKRLPVAWTA